MSTLNAAQVRPHSSRLTLLLLAAVFVLPFLLGTGLFWLDWRPQKFGNHGELVKPALALPESGFRHADGRPLPTAELRGKWLLLMPVHEACDAVCQTMLQQTLQVHVALNKEQSRLQRVLMVSGEVGSNASSAQAHFAPLQSRFPDLVLARVSDQSMAALWDSALDRQQRPIYVVDPLGNVMMRYSDPGDMRGVLKDLERLLKYSWIR